MNVLIQPVSGSIYFDNNPAGSSATIPGNVTLSYNTSGALTISSNASASTLRFAVSGGQGGLFSVYDSLTGQIFAVNKLGGIPVLEAYDTDTVKLGTYLSNTLLVSGTQVSMGGLPLSAAVPNKLSVIGNTSITGSLNVGINNTVTNASSVLGGTCNTVSGLYSTVVGGLKNLVTGNNAVVAGGCLNCATGYATFVGAGSGNCATGDYSIAAGGQTNCATTLHSVIVGGNCNYVTGTCQNFIGGGACNCVNSGCQNVIVGGCQNCITTGYQNFVGGGRCNTASGSYNSTVVGGFGNTASGNQATVAGGARNSATGYRATATGGIYSTASGTNSIIAGGAFNTASSCYSVINGGCRSTASGPYTYIGNGPGNLNTQRNSIIVGGAVNHTGGYTPIGVTNAALSGNGTCTQINFGANCTSCFSSTGVATSLSIFYSTSAIPLSAGCFVVADNISSAGNCLIVRGDFTVAPATSATCLFVYDRCLNQGGGNNFIGGGSLNTASNCYSIVVGGRRNTASNLHTAVLGGSCSIASGSYTAILGGLCNTASGNYSLIVAGSGNSVAAIYSSIVGGTGNCINAGGGGNFIGGGCCNSTSFSCSVVVGGQCNCAGGVDVVVGGFCNTASANYSVVVGGAKNNALNNYSFIAGGQCNHTNGFANTFILGSNLSASAVDYTYVNNISSQGAGVVGGSATVNGATTLNGRVVVGGIISSSYTGATDSSVVLSGGNTKGGTGYNDFLRVYNPAGTNSLWFRTNNAGGLELISSDYTKNLFSVSQYGNVNIYGNNAAVSTNSDGVSGTLQFNANSSQIYDDGNFHIHSRISGQSMWINTNGADIRIGQQAPVLNGAVANSIMLGGTSISTPTAYVNILGSKTYNIPGPYGYLNSGGAGSIASPGSTGNVAFGLYVANRTQSAEVDVTSDERVKNIQGTIPLEDAIKFVKNVNGIKYTWKEGFGDEGLKTGFGAQSVHKAGFEHMISHISNDKIEGKTDEDGWIHPDKTQLSMGYNQAIPYHHEVIKHLLERINELEAEVLKLKK